MYTYMYMYGQSEIESRWGRDFPSVQTGPGDHSSSCKMGTASFPGVKCGRGVQLTTHPLGHTGPVTGSLYVYMYMYMYGI